MSAHVLLCIVEPFTFSDMVPFGTHTLNISYRFGTKRPSLRVAFAHRRLNTEDLGGRSLIATGKHFESFSVSCVVFVKIVPSKITCHYC